MTKQSRLGLLLLVVAIIGWLGVVRPQATKLSETLLQARIRDAEVDSYAQRITDLNDIKKQGEAIQGTIKALYLAMPRGSQVPEALVMIEQLGTGAGIVFTSASVGAPTGTEVPVSLSFTGNKDNVNHFFDGLYANIRTAVVKSQQLTVEKSGTLTATVQLGLVYQGGTNE